MRSETLQVPAPHGSADSPMDRPIKKTFLRRHRKPLYVGAGLFAVLLITGVLRYQVPDDSIRVPSGSLSFGTVAQGPINDNMQLRLTAVPRDTVFIDASEGGKVQRLLINPGDRIIEGQPLLLLTNTQLELQVLEQEVRLIESMNQLQNAQTSLEQSRLSNEMALSEIEYNITRLAQAQERTRVLVERGFISQSRLDEIDVELANYRRKQDIQIKSNEKSAAHRAKQVPQLANQLDTLEEDLKITRSKLDNLTVKAPYAGLVTAMDLTLGQTLRQGDRLAQITLDTGFKLSQAVDEFYLPRLHTGQAGEVQVGDKTWPVSLARIYPQVKNGVFIVELVFAKKSPANLLPGQAVLGKLFFNAAPRHHAVFMPAGAYLEHTGGQWVFVVSPDGRKAVRRTIRVGRRNPEQIEVLDGIKPGERIITSDYKGLAQSSQVTIE